MREWKMILISKAIREIIFEKEILREFHFHNFTHHFALGFRLLEIKTKNTLRGLKMQINSET